ncbi:MAG: Npun_F0813 family protein [Cyanobacteria bacterium P01_A01_bin.114]
MFILKRQDVEIKSFQHPSKDQKIPILSYQGQTFRLLSVFTASQEEDARTLWRDLTDNRGKACVLLEEPERFSIWGKIRLDGAEMAAAVSQTSSKLPLSHIQACVLILQAIYEDIEDLLGAKQAKRFESDLAVAGAQLRLPQGATARAVHNLLNLDPLYGQLPAWQEKHLNSLLSSLYDLGKTYFGKANFTDRAMASLDDLSVSERDKFLQWLSQSPNGDLWQ